MAAKLISPLQKFIEQQVKLGNSASEQEAKAQILEALDELETERAINIGVQQSIAGETTPLNEEFIQSLKKRVLGKTVSHQQ